MKIPTIKDISERCGVSVTTISRVLNANYPVSEETRQKVLRAIEELNYRPNLIARSLKSKKSDVIGLVVADISNQYFMEIAKEIERVASEYGYNIIISSTNGSAQREHQVLSTVQDRRIAALIIASSDSNAEHLKKLVDNGIPVVLIDRTLDGLNADMVLEDNFQIAYNLTNLLIRKGHSRIACASVLLSVSSGRQRLEGYLQALSDAQIPVDKRLISGENFSADQAAEWLKGLFYQKKRSFELPTAIFCANNLMAAGVLSALRELEIRVPQDISMVSFGEIPMQALIEPKITASLQDGRAIGASAAELVLERLEHNQTGPYKKIVLNPQIVERGSIKSRL